MALRELNLSLGLKTDKFEDKLKGVERSLTNFSRAAEGIGRKLGQAVTLPLFAAGGAAVKTFADFQKLQKGFETLFGAGNEAAAKRFFEELQAFSARTPFQLKDIADSARQLLAFGLTADQAKDSLQFLGDIAAATNSNLGDLTLIFGQAKAIGTVFTQDLRQLANRGVPVFDLLKEKFDVTGEELQKMVKDGKISFEVLQDVLKSTTEAGGLFAGGMEKQSKTLSGLFSTLKDNITLAFAEIGESIDEAFDLQAIMQRLTETAQRAVRVFINMDDSTKRLVIRIAAYTAAIGPALFVTGKIAGVLSTIPGILRLLNTGFATLSGSILKNAAAFGKLNVVAKASVIGAIAIAVTGLVTIISALNERLQKATEIGRTLNEVQAESSVEVEKASSRTKLLIDVLKDENATRIEKEKALERLKKIDADHFGNLEIEKGKVEGLTEANDAYLETLKQQAVIKAAQSRIDEIADKRLELQTALREKLNILNDAANAKTVVAKGLALLQARAAGQNVLALDKELKALQKKEEALEDVIKASRRALDLSLGVGTGTGTGDEDEDEIVTTTTIISKLPTRQEIEGRKINLADVALGGIPGLTEPIPEGVVQSVEKLTNQYDLFGKLTSGSIKTLQDLGATVEQQEPIIQKHSTAWERLGENIGAALSDAAVIATGAMIELAAQGETSFRKLANAALQAAAKFVRVQIIEGVAAAVKSALVTIPFPFNIIAAGAAGAAAGVLFNKVISSIGLPTLAGGGLAFEPTLAVVGDNPGARTNPEVIAPLDKLQSLMGGGNITLSGEFRIKGTDLILTLDRVQKKRERSRGF